MKCFAINGPGELRKYILPAEIRKMLPPALVKRKRIASCYLDFEFFPGFTYGRFKDRGYEDMYSFGVASLSDKQTQHSKYIPKNSILVLFDHTKYYCDRAEGDASRMIWVDHKWGLVITTQTHFRLREVETNFSWAMDAKQTKLIKHIL